MTPCQRRDQLMPPQMLMMSLDLGQQVATGGWRGRWRPPPGLHHRCRTMGPQSLRLHHRTRTSRGFSSNTRLPSGWCPTQRPPSSRRQLHSGPRQPINRNRRHPIPASTSARRGPPGAAAARPSSRPRARSWGRPRRRRSPGHPSTAHPRPRRGPWPPTLREAWPRPWATGRCWPPQAPTPAKAPLRTVQRPPGVYTERAGQRPIA
mmetsp:Transcript_92053/g.263761  ORF Transcript_92053/g.263761 Transcript_92053/m.263761 type:complete len:206 (+) Transcript_92053:317-934(+)